MNTNTTATGQVTTTPEIRETYVAGIREKLNKIETKMTSMRDESSRMAGDLKKKAEENLTKLDSKFTELKLKADGFKDVAEDKWHSTKEAFEKSFEDVATNFKGLFK